MTKMATKKTQKEYSDAEQDDALVDFFAGGALTKDEVKKMVRKTKTASAKVKRMPVEKGAIMKKSASKAKKMDLNFCA